MKKNFIMFLGCLSTLGVFAESVQVGDSVLVLRSTKCYLTGERISQWVYQVPHLVSQVGTKQWPDAILLNIDGACSWLGANDVELLSMHHSAVASVETQEKEEITPVEPIPVPETPVTPPVVVSPTDVVEVPAEQLVKQPEPAAPIVSAPQKEVVATPEVVKESKSKAKFQMNGDAGFLFNGGLFGFAADLTLGSRVCDYVFVGGGLGFHCWLGGQAEEFRGALQGPVYANTRIYYPVRETLSPYLDFSIGATLGTINYVTDPNNKNGFYYGLYSRVGLGIDFHNFTVSAGYEYGPGRTENPKDYHCGYIKIGFTFPKTTYAE